VVDSVENGRLLWHLDAVRRFFQNYSACPYRVFAGMIWSGAMMLEFLGNGDANYTDAHDAIMKAVETVLVHGPNTPDLGGSGNTTDVGRAIAAAL
jgi:hypothetical protein